MAASPAPNTFEEMARSLRLYVPQLPYPLAQQFIRDRYRRVTEIRGWSGSRGEGEFIINAAKTAGTVAVIRNSSTVTGAGTAFATPDDVGRQFKGGAGSPIYTITAVDAGLQTLTLDRPFGGDSGTGQTYFVFDGYVTPPSDFLQFVAVTDPRNAWRLQWWITQDELNRWDPQRTFFGTAYALVDRRFNAAGQPTFELWPYNTTNRNYPFYYFKRVADLVQDSDLPIWPIRSDVIVYGALADLCLWPGTPEKPNPLFGAPGKLSLQMFEAKYQDGLVEMERRDEDIYMTWLATASNMGYPFSPLSASFIQSHAV